MRINRIEIINIYLIKNDTVLKAYVEDADRFNGRLLNLILKGKVEGETPVGIDNIHIQKVSGEFDFSKNEIGENQLSGYKFSAECIAYDDEDATAIAVVIDKNISIKSCNRMEKMSDADIKIEMCKLVIPYKSKIQLGIING